MKLKGRQLTRRGLDEENAIAKEESSRVRKPALGVYHVAEQRQGNILRCPNNKTRPACVCRARICLALLQY